MFPILPYFFPDISPTFSQGFLEASTFYFYPRSGYHLLALLEDGLASPLLAQLVDGIRSLVDQVS
jgi:hypothetical protein